MNMNIHHREIWRRAASFGFWVLCSSVSAERVLFFLVIESSENDPAAGSPTATLLRLLLPLLKKCRWSSLPRKSGGPTTCIAPSSETTTGGVYKWQGRNRHSLMNCAYETFLVARPIIAILGPNRVYVIPVIPRSFESSRTPVRESCSH